MTAKQRTIDIGLQYRACTLDRESVDEEARTIELSFSSENPVERYFGVEILDHSPGAARLERLRSAGPLLDNHLGDQVAVVEHAEIGSDRKGRARVRFGKSARADELFRDVVDGIRRNVSVGYALHEMVLESRNEDTGVSTYRVTDWEPLEISLVPVPADPSVGVGRERERTTSVTIHEPADEETRDMPPEDTKTQTPPTPAPPPAVDVKAERKSAAELRNKEIVEILAIARKHGLEAEAQTAIAEGKTLAEFRALALEKIGNLTPVVKPPEIGMTDKEVKRYSLVKALRDAAFAGGVSGLEREASDAMAKRLGRQAQSFFVPYDVIAHRDLNVAAATAGGNLVATNLLASSFIDLLRNRMVVQRAGARVLSGLTGDLAIPKQTGGATAYWVAEGVDVTESQQTIGQVALTPKTVGALTEYTRKLLLQSSVDIEAFVRADLAAVTALALDLAALEGSGAGAEPTGVRNVSGIGSVAIGTNGGAPTWAKVVDLETEVSQDNADVGALAYITNAKVRGKCKTTEKASNTGQFIWENGTEAGVGVLNGYPAYVSNQAPSNISKGTGTNLSVMYFGNWADLIIGMWSGLDVLVDPYTHSASGTVRIVVHQDVDIAVRHAESFAVCADIDTS